MKYEMTAIVDRVVTDHISLKVEAATEDEAFLIARRALLRFPDDHGEDEKAVPFCYVDKRENSSGELMELRMKEKTVA